MQNTMLVQSSEKNRLRIPIQSDDGSGFRTGLSASTDGLQVAYIRDTDTSPTRLDLLPCDGAEHIQGGFREIDSDLMPGLYELCLPDQLCAPGARKATLLVQGPGLQVHTVSIELIAYDPYDSYRLGIGCLSVEGRHEVIAKAFHDVVPDIVEEFRRNPGSD